MLVSPNMSDAAPSARAWLKSRTDAVHARLDADLSTFDLTQLDEYRAFLAVHRLALPVLERAIAESEFSLRLPAWDGSQREDALAADLEGTGQQTPAATTQPKLTTEHAWGVAYVLEGSRLGGKVLTRRAMRSADERVRENTKFLSHRGTIRWPEFIAKMEVALVGAASRERALDGAMLAFQTYTDAFAAVRGEGANRERTTLA